MTNEIRHYQEMQASACRAQMKYRDNGALESAIFNQEVAALAYRGQWNYLVRLLYPMVEIRK